MSTFCLRCLSHSLRDLSRPRSQAFTTSAILSATPPKKSKAPVVAVRKGGLKLRKTVRAKPAGRPPAPGERKANKKKVVLSNTNALAVRSNTLNSDTPLQEGEVLAFANATIDTLRALQAFKPTQRWGLFRNASTLVRSETVALAKAIEQAEQKATRIVLAGERASGKSVLQLQAMSIAHLRGWVLINIPEGQDLTIGTTAYQPAIVDGQRVYTQPQYTATLLDSLLKANEKILATLRLGQTHRLPIPVPDNISLARLADLVAKDPAISWPIFNAIIQELTAPSQEGEGLQRPPLLITIDGLTHLMKPSDYVDPRMNKIHAHELAIVSSMLGFMNGSSALPNGGMVLGATSFGTSPTLEHIIASRTGMQAVWDPYTARDERVDKALNGVSVIKVGGVSKNEAKGAMEYYALSGIFRDRVTAAAVAEKWSLSGGGIIGELEKSCVKQKF